MRYNYEIFKGLISRMQLFFLMLVSKLKDMKYDQFTLMLYNNIM